MHYTTGIFTHIAGDLVEVDGTHYQIIARKAYAVMQTIPNGTTVRIGYDPVEPAASGYPKGLFLMHISG